MPFTIAHAAAVLPFRSLPIVRFSMAALVLGSFTPDAGYLFGGAMARLSHSFRGSFYFDIPVGFALYLLFRAIRSSLIDLLPNPHSSALTIFNRPNNLSPLIILASVWLGAATHILWDSFTHTDGWVTLRVPALRELVIVFGRPLPWCRLLQFASSGLGLLALALVYLRWLRQQTTNYRKSGSGDLPRYALWLSIFFLPAIGVTLHNYLLLRRSRGSFGLAYFAYKTVAEVLVAVIFVIIFAALMHRLYPLVPAMEKSDCQFNPKK